MLIKYVIAFLLAWTTFAHAELLVCPYDVENIGNEWLRRLPLNQLASDIRRQIPGDRPWRYSGTLSELEVAGNRALLHLDLGRLDATTRNAVLTTARCEIVTNEAAVKRPARAPRLVGGVVTFDDNDAQRPVINPTQFGLPRPRRASIDVPSFFTWLFSPRAAFAQIVNGVLDDFNRAAEDPLSGGGNWGSRIDSDSDADEMRLTTNVVTRGTSGVSTSYWAAATFTDPEVFFSPTGGTTQRSNLHIVYAGPNTTTPDGYRAFVIKSAGDDSWQLHRIDDGVATELGTAQTSEHTDGTPARMQHVSGVIVVQNCPTTCTTIRTESDATYSGAAWIGLGVNSDNITIDDFGGGTLTASSRLSVGFKLLR